MAESAIKIRKFRELNITDPFFDSLRSSYSEFNSWFGKKADESAFVVFDDANCIQAFLYVKIESGPVIDITPILNVTRSLKVGTFKVNAHGTKLGERFVKIISDMTLSQGVRHAYVTVFPEHEALIGILIEFGFSKWGTKQSKNGSEDVFVKDMTKPTGDILYDYPVVDTRNRKKWLLAIYPEFHSILFPDSILNNENPSIIRDVDFTNSIHKVYLGHMVSFPEFTPGDCVVIYKCNSSQKVASAWYTSVATSLCVVEEVRPKRSFTCAEDMIRYCNRYSVFNEQMLHRKYNEQKKTELHTIKMTYNIAFPKRPNLKSLVEQAKLPEPANAYYGLLPLDDAQFKKIMELGHVYEGSAFY
jgi:hypothetical protein